MFNELSNNHIKKLTRLNNKKYRKLYNQAIVEGVRLIDQLNDYNIKFEEIIFSGSYTDEISKYSTENLYFATQDQMGKITATKTPQNIAALVNTTSIPIPDKKFLLYLDDINDPGNLGAIFRTATAAGVSGIILSPGCCEVYNPKVIRASLGSVFFLPSEIHDHDWLKKQQTNIIATSLEDSSNLFELKKPDNLILIIGSEAFGVNKKILQISDFRARIPIPGNIESLNAAVAAGIAIYHFIGHPK